MLWCAANVPASRTRNLFTGGNMRGPVNAGTADYVPVFLSEIPLLMRRAILPIDVALVQV
jgi:4-hydroxybutyrate CoA-transferase